MRLLWEGVRLALGAIWGNKMRSFLTLLANVIAVSSVIAVVSIISGMDAYVREKVAGEGSGVFQVAKTDPLLALSSLDDFMDSLRNPDVTVDDLEAIQRGVRSADAIAAQVSRSSSFRAGRLHVDSGRARGVAGDYAAVVSWKLADGRHIAPSELRRSAPVTVVGWDVVEELFPGKDPLEQQLRIKGRRLRIVGVVERQGSVFGQSQDMFALVPLGVYQKLFGSRQSLRIDVKVGDPDRLEEARDEARQAMRVQHRLRPGDKEDFALVSREALIGLWRQLSTQFFVVIIAIAAVSLVIGGIVIMNIMLVSVTERTREIGLRKALGARHQSILWQFLIESVTFSVTGGVIGIVAGFAFASAVAAMSPLPYAIETFAVIVALFVTAGVGLVFGLYPASRAARLDPIEALHWE